MSNDITRPIIGIENRTAQEVFDIMCDRARSLAQEREELRGALKTIARGTSNIFDRNPQTMSFNEAQSIARAALKDT